jgi:hypothetical protein
MAVILDIEDFKALVRAAEDTADARELNEVRRQLATGEDEMIDFRRAREERLATRSSDKAEREE